MASNVVEEIIDEEEGVDLPSTQEEVVSLEKAPLSEDMQNVFNCTVYVITSFIVMISTVQHIYHHHPRSTSSSFMVINNLFFL